MKRNAPGTVWGEKVGQRGALHYPLFYDDTHSCAWLEGGSWCSNLWFYSDSGVGKKTVYPRPHHSITRYVTFGASHLSMAVSAKSHNLIVESKYGGSVAKAEFLF